MGALHRQCLWEHLTPRRPQALALGGEIKADVCVIGAGYTGLSAALHLLEAGRSVCVVEAHETGHGGSGRNVGLVNAGTWIRPDDAEATLGPEVGAKLNGLLGHAPAEVFALIARLGIDCQARRDGTLHMAHNAAGAADLRLREAQWLRRGARVELLTGARCAEYCGTDKVAAALLDHRAGTLNPMAYVCGLAEAVQRLGGRLFHHSPVVRLERQGDRWCVSTARGSVLAEKVVIASNAYTEGDWTQIRRHFFAGYYYQVASVPLQGEAAQRILPHAQGSWDTRTVLSSIRRDAEGRLVLGSLGNGEGKPDWFMRSWADRIQRHYFPSLGKLEWQFAWSGRIAFTPDHLMKLFEPAPGLLAVTGYNGRGVTTGTVVGKAFAEFLLHEDPEGLPLPFDGAKAVSLPGVRSALYEAGFSLYHAGQCLRVVL
ncbi:FAD-binding oxidoreductase [Pseudomonas sp. RIT-PI-AD]|uniref:L-pipecolate oxidase n=1 Tax=Pseudomonas sp. RIT-PI-AD TaxID=3035294 RepID=UPI0021DA647F|nr:FAD-binding oxidoreductase [Pseudomonas sp. RIT-PI-AD]